MQTQKSKARFNEARVRKIHIRQSTLRRRTKMHQAMLLPNKTLRRLSQVSQALTSVQVHHLLGQRPTREAFRWASQST